MLLLLALMAAEPYQINQAPQYSRVGGSALTVAWDMSTTSQMVHRRHGSALPLIVPWDSMVVLCSDAEVQCAWTMTSSVVLNASSGAQACEILHPHINGQNGPAMCMALPAAGCTDDMPQLATARTSPGRVPGVCSTVIALDNNMGLVRAACRIDGDCIDAGHAAGTTCNLDPSDAMWLQSGAMIECVGPAAAHVTVRVQR